MPLTEGAGNLDRAPVTRLELSLANGHVCAGLVDPFVERRQLPKVCGQCRFVRRLLDTQGDRVQLVLCALDALHEALNARARRGDRLADGVLHSSQRAVADVEMTVTRGRGPDGIAQHPVDSPPSGLVQIRLQRGGERLQQVVGFCLRQRTQSCRGGVDGNAKDVGYEEERVWSREFLAKLPLVPPESVGELVGFRAVGFLGDAPFTPTLGQPQIQNVAFDDQRRQLLLGFLQLGTLSADFLQQVVVVALQPSGLACVVPASSLHLVPQHVDPQVVAEALDQVETQEPVDRLAQSSPRVVLGEFRDLLAVEEEEVGNADWHEFVQKSLTRLRCQGASLAVFRQRQSLRARCVHEWTNFDGPCSACACRAFRRRSRVRRRRCSAGRWRQATSRCCRAGTCDIPLWRPPCPMHAGHRGRA